MALFRINGVTMTVELDGTAPEGHFISGEPPNLAKTAGGNVAVEPASGNPRKHTWSYGRRTTRAVRAILNAIGTDNGGICVIDTPGVTKVGYGSLEQYTNVVVMVQIPDFRITGNGEFVEPYELTFVECYSQT